MTRSTHFLSSLLELLLSGKGRAAEFHAVHGRAYWGTAPRHRVARQQDQPRMNAAQYQLSIACILPGAQTVRRLIKAGKLKVYCVGREIRIDECDAVD